jgi:hypothetical protein
VKIENQNLKPQRTRRNTKEWDRREESQQAKPGWPPSQIAQKRRNPGALVPGALDWPECPKWIEVVELSKEIREKLTTD